MIHDIHLKLVQSALHHFTKAQKTALYRKVCASLAEGGCFILTDYFADTEETEALFFAELTRLKAEQGITDGDFYHYDTPLTVAHETEALLAGGFARVETVGTWGATHTLVAYREP